MTSKSVLVRYGAIPEVARFLHALQEPLPRGTDVVVRSHRGVETGVLLESIETVEESSGPSGNGRHSHNDAPSTSFQVLRRATDEDLTRQKQLRESCEREFQTWRERIQQWKLQLELIDTEWTLDQQKLILYVLNERGPECTKLALAAAAAGLGIIEVQPVSADGLVSLPNSSSGGGGCGSGNCGCG